MKESCQLQMDFQKIEKDAPEFQQGYRQELLRLELSELLQTLRQEQGLCRKHFASLVGEKEAVIADIENGLWEPSLFTMQKLLLPLNLRLSIQAVPLCAPEPAQEKDTPR